MVEKARPETLESAARKSQEERILRSLVVRDEWKSGWRQGEQTLLLGCVAANVLSGTGDVWMVTTAGLCRIRRYVSSVQSP